ncbi:MAG: hypothetical protein ACI81V_001466 [Lentimonas sp.]|jgi:hypothetical protein
MLYMFDVFLSLARFGALYLVNWFKNNDPIL